MNLLALLSLCASLLFQMIKQVTVLVAVIVCSCAVHAQDVEVTAVQGGVSLAVSAHKYQVMAGQDRVPVLTVECVRKGKKGGHLVLFQPGGEMLQAGDGGLRTATAPQSLTVIIDGKQEATMWTPFSDTSTFAYYGKTEPERVQFLHLMLNAGSVSIEFKPFLTGVKVKSVFDLTQMREEIKKHPECSEQ